MSCERCDATKGVEWAEKKEPFLYQKKLYQYVEPDWIKTPVACCPWCGESVDAGNLLQEEFDLVLRRLRWARKMERKDEYLALLEHAFIYLGGDVNAVYKDRKEFAIGAYIAWRDDSLNVDAMIGLCSALLTEARRWLGVEKEYSLRGLQEEVLGW